MNCGMVVYCKQLMERELEDTTAGEEGPCFARR